MFSEVNGASERKLFYKIYMMTEEMLSRQTQQDLTKREKSEIDL
jgi:hypothetical protein